METCAGERKGVQREDKFHKSSRGKKSHVTGRDKGGGDRQKKGGVGKHSNKTRGKLGGMAKKTGTSQMVTPNKKKNKKNPFGEQNWRDLCGNQAQRETLAALNWGDGGGVLGGFVTAVLGGGIT